jgi:hypothetical protein
MATGKDRVHVEISDVYDPEQETRVIDAVKGLSKLTAGQLSEYFRETDTLLVKKVSPEEAERVSRALEGTEVSVRIIEPGVSRVEKEAENVRGPACGFVLEFLDWRCRE